MSLIAKHGDQIGGICTRPKLNVVRIYDGIFIVIYFFLEFIGTPGRNLRCKTKAAFAAAGVIDGNPRLGKEFTICFLARLVEINNIK
ncbi:MAG: hypothetical protein KKD65_02245 [Gammaproteobacteria bacterium]|nr:hypothetical protein [Gammaproteobacteria bacterium]